MSRALRSLMLHAARCVLRAAGTTQHARMPACLHVAFYKGLVVAGCTVHVACACCTSRALRCSPFPAACCTMHVACRAACWMPVACCRCMLHVVVAAFSMLPSHVRTGRVVRRCFRAACFTELVACCRTARAIRIASCLLQYTLRTPAASRSSRCTSSICARGSGRSD